MVVCVVVIKAINKLVSMPKRIIGYRYVVRTFSLISLKTEIFLNLSSGGAGQPVAFKKILNSTRFPFERYTSSII